MSAIMTGFHERAQKVLEIMFPYQDVNDWSEILATEMKIREDYTKKILMGWINPSDKFAKNFQKFTRADAVYLFSGEGQPFSDLIDDERRKTREYRDSLDSKLDEFEKILTTKMGISKEELFRNRSSIPALKLLEIYRLAVKLSKYVNEIVEMVDEELEDRENASY